MKTRQRIYIRITQVVMRLAARVLARLAGAEPYLYDRENAMHGAGRFYTDRWGHVTLMPACHYAGWYVYVSPNGTPWAATWGMGPGWQSDDPDGRKKVRLRRLLWGHNYDSDALDPQLLDHALWVVESRHRPVLTAFVRMFDERAAWLETP